MEIASMSKREQFISMLVFSFVIPKMDARFFQGKSTNEQVSTIWRYLDGLAQNDPEKYNQFIKKTLEDGKKDGLGPPKPKFVLQTHKLPRMIPVRDFFINGCQWEQIPETKTENDPIKMIASDIREELIENKMCFTVDVAVNSKVMEKCLERKEEKKMLIDLMIRYVEANNSCRLDSNYNVIDEAYKGNRDNLLDMMCPVSVREAAKESTAAFSEEKLIKELRKMVTSESSVVDKGLELGGVQGAQKRSNDVVLPSQVHLKSDSFISESNKGNNKDVKESRNSENEGKDVAKVNNEGVNKKSGSQGNLNIDKNDVKTVRNSLIEPKYSKRSEIKGDEEFEVIEVNLPRVTKMDDCDLDVGEDFLELLVPEKFALSLKFDEKFDEDETEAFFIRLDWK